ncbi:hypothetical protein I6A60_39940 [Frankia sp. AgB1.9]|uniref:hypothetical protein n=1 Tax=unclassified Frankia TaxID=2632575 RepID=UPI001931C00D|nr:MULTISPECIES: hypothetical protein [unclassified Frankia]MBL7490638.1 hypothetical protein [Frankia sp. AgW1.1]MBL7553957.1 hypothetical protein [Frankia sp. AgB1.9]MBL7623278.1 hypothetical protein [Frankia sp. AgB1.8]
MSGTDPWRNAGSELGDSDRRGDDWGSATGSQAAAGWPPHSTSPLRDSWTPSDDWPRTGPQPTGPGIDPADRGSLVGPLDPATGGILRPRYVPRPVADRRNLAGPPLDQSYPGWPDDDLDDEGEEDDDEYEDVADLDDGLGDDDYDDDGYSEDDEDPEDDAVAEKPAAATRASRFGESRRPAARRWSQDPAPAGGRASKPRIGRGPRVLIIAVVVLIVGGVTYWTMTGGSAGTSAAPPAPLPTAQPVPADFLDSAFTDSDAVTANEFFRDGSVVAGAHTYTRVASKLDQGCPDLTGIVALALAGQAPLPTAAATPAAGPSASGAPAPGASAAATPAAPVTPGPLCRQLVRALYVGEPDKSGRRLLAGIGVLVVDSATTAKNAVQALGAGAGGVTPLPLPTGALPGAKISGPNGNNNWRTAFSDGHYAVVLQLAYSDDTKGKATDAVLTDAATDLKKITTSPLDDRAVLGRGYRG